MKLKWLDLSSTQINDAGCAALASALDRGALPALDRQRQLDLHGIPASDAATAAVMEAVERTASRASSVPST